MCDQKHYNDLEERVDTLEARQNAIDKSNAVISEQIKNLVKSTDNLKHVVYAFTLLLLLTVIYGAVGSSGFNAITRQNQTMKGN